MTLENKLATQPVEQDTVETPGEDAPTSAWIIMRHYKATSRPTWMLGAQMGEFREQIAVALSEQGAENLVRRLAEEELKQLQAAEVAVLNTYSPELRTSLRDQGRESHDGWKSQWLGVRVDVSTDLDTISATFTHHPVTYRYYAEEALVVP